jgi:hypothetical protein
MKFLQEAGRTHFKENTMSEVYTQHGTGGAIGVEAASHVDRHSESYCTSERQRIETVNRPAILALRARVGQMQDEALDLEGRINHAAPPGTVATRKRKAIFRYAIAVLLTVAAFIFSVLAFDPYQLGWKAWLYCLGIAIVTPFLVDRILERWASPRLVNLLATVAGIAAIVSLVLLGEIRGDLLAQQVSSAPTAVIENADDVPPPVTENTFYDRTLGLLRLVMAFLAFAIEIGAGVALYEAGQWSSATGEDATALRCELAAVRERMIAHGHEFLALENAGAAFEHEFWRDFYRSLLNGVKRGALQKLVIFALSLGALAHGQASAGDRADLVILLDLSQSVAVKGQGSKAEFEKNTASITSILATLPAGTKVTIVGITDDSFATPYMILSAELAGDEGYFKERLAKGHAALTHAWKERSAGLAPRCAETDILGALLVASEVFRASPSGHRKVLVVLSDMKQATRALNLERQSMVQTLAAMRQVANNRLLADLRGVEVYAEGVDGAGESVGYWQSLHDFWTAYFVQAGATLERYSALRDVPEFERSHPITVGSHER